MKELTQARLKELLHYDPDSGVFIWRINRGTAKTGDVAGNIDKYSGYLRISINYKLYYAQRLAFLYCTGYYPEHDIDHIDRNRANNSICNLREATRSCNMRNSGNYKSNTSGVKGVSFDRTHNKWDVYIKINNKPIRFGKFNSFDEAVCLRLAAEQAEDWPGCDSSSPAYQYVQKMLSASI